MFLISEIRLIINILILKDIKNYEIFNNVLKTIIEDRINNSFKTYVNIVNEFGVYRAIKYYEEFNEEFHIDDNENKNNEKLSIFIIIKWFQINYSFKKYEEDLYEYKNKRDLLIQQIEKEENEIDKKISCYITDNGL